MTRGFARGCQLSRFSLARQAPNLAAMAPRTPNDETQQVPASSSVLDRPLARLAALGVFLCVAGALAYMHRDDLLPPPAVQPAADDPVALCLAARAKDIDQMLADGVIDAGQATMFKSRAEALCVAQEGQGAGPPPRLPAN